jgi:cell division protein FtsB
MENKVVGYIPRLLFKIYLNLKDKFDPKPNVTDEEIFAAEICEKLIINPTSELSFSPISNKRILKNEEKSMYIVMESHTIHLINHVYSYSVYLQDTSKFMELTKIFDKVLEDRREILEHEIRKNIQHSLSNILDKLN